MTELKTKTVEIDGARYVLRQITVQEADEAYDAAKGPDGEIDSRLHSRLILAASLVEPQVTIDDLLSWPFIHYMRVLAACNELNVVSEGFFLQGASSG